MGMVLKLKINLHKVVKPIKAWVRLVIIFESTGIALSFLNLGH